MKESSVIKRVKPSDAIPAASRKYFSTEQQINCIN